MPEQDEHFGAMSANSGTPKIPADAPARSSRWRIPAIVGIVLVVLIAAAVYRLTGEGFVIELTEQQIQDKLDAQFPMEKRYLVALAVTLSDPKVTLVEGSDRIALGIKTTVSAGMLGQSRQFSGSGMISTGLSYDAATYSFHLKDPTIDELSAEGMPVEHVDRVNTLAAELVRDRLNRMPIYTLQGDDVKQQAARLVLKDLTVRNGKLIIAFGL